MGEKIKRIESIRSELAKKPNESVKKEKVEQKIGVDEVMKRLKNILEKKGAFDTLNELKNLPPALKEERKLLRIKEGLKDRRNVARFTDLLTTQERWRKDREEWTQKEPQDKLSQRMIKLADSILKQNEEAIKEKLKKLGLLKNDN